MDNIQGPFSLRLILPACVCLLAMTVLYLSYQKVKFSPVKNKKKELMLKGGATLSAALLAGYGWLLSPCGGKLFLFLGLMVCTAADVILDLRFLPGTACFALGHICYSAACLLTNKPGTPSLILFLALTFAAVLLYPGLKKLPGKKSTLPYLGYALVLSAMLALALPQKPVLFIGAALFMLSDGMLLYSIIFRGRSRAYDYLCLGCYYLAQFLIAFSALA